MKGYKLLSHYYERKSAAGIAALVCAKSHRAEDREEAEALADEALASYLDAAGLMHDSLDPIMMTLRGRPMREGAAEIPELIEVEKQEREDLGSIFRWGESRYTGSE
jgi:hypothetical protein